MMHNTKTITTVLRETLQYDLSLWW